MIQLIIRLCVSVFSCSSPFPPSLLITYKYSDALALLLCKLMPSYTYIVLAQMGNRTSTTREANIIYALCSFDAYACWYFVCRCLSYYYCDCHRYITYNLWPDRRIYLHANLLIIISFFNLKLYIHTYCPYLFILVQSIHIFIYSCLFFHPCIPTYITSLI